MASDGGGVPVGGIYGEIELRTGDLDQRLRQVESRMKEATQEFQRGERAVTEYAAEMRRLGQEAEQLGRQIAQAQQAGGSFVVSTAQVARGSRNMGMAVMEGGRALEDLQYGINGVVNNIPSLVMALGGTAGLTGVISVATVGAYQLYKNWDVLMDSFGVGVPQPALSGLDLLEQKLGKVNERLDELQGKSRLTFPEFQELNNLQREQADLEQKTADRKRLDQFFGAPSDEDQARGKAFGDVVRNELGAENFGNELVTRLMQRSSNGVVSSNALGIEGSPQEIARQLTLRALSGSIGSRDEIVGLLGDQSRMGKAITEGSPEAAAQRKMLFEQGQENEKFAREQAEMERKAEEEYIQEDERENERRLQKRRQQEEKAEREAEQQRERDIAARAKPFLEGNARIGALSGQLDESQVRTRLEAAGDSKASELAGPVLEEVMKQLGKEVGARAVSGSMTQDEARAVMLEEARQPEEDADKRRGELMERLREEQENIRKPRGVERFAASELYQSLQTSGMDENREQVRKLAGIEKLLEEIRDLNRTQPGGPATVG